MIDVDEFKSSNDSFGHLEGNELLRRIATLLKEQARATDFVARFGGEEFAVVLPNTDQTGAFALAERFRHATEQTDWPRRPITISIGVASFNPAMTHINDLVNAADQALYKAKQQGRNRVVQAAPYA